MKDPIHFCRAADDIARDAELARTRAANGNDGTARVALGWAIDHCSRAAAALGLDGDIVNSLAHIALRVRCGGK